ncbi:MAG: AraD1 family protein [Chloroflexota bacterium]
MRLVQFMSIEGQRKVGVVNEDQASLSVLNDTDHVYDLAMTAIETEQSLESIVRAKIGQARVDYDQIIADKRLLVPLDHPNPAHCILSGTGLDHLGSAQARDSMHAKLDADETELTDSMKMFKMGLEGGKPEKGKVGVAPEWFYKGNGNWLVAPEKDLESPAFALDGGEEPELVGLYVVGPTGQVFRVGSALGNEFSDHVIERKNYLYLAHSKLRNSSFGPELLVGDFPTHISGTVRIIRDGETLWSDTFLTGEDNMTHTIANIEHHHFKYDQFRQPGNVHCHFFGTATLSIAAGVTTQAGDVFEISAPQFGRPLRNTLTVSGRPERLTEIKTL